MATRAQWNQRIRKWKKSGLSLAEFAAREGLPVNQLSWWRWKLGTTEAPEPTSATEPRFLPVRVVTPPVSSAPTPIEIALPNGRLVRVQPGFDPPTLERVLAIAAEVPKC